MPNKSGSFFVCLFLLLNIGIKANAQYSKTHYIAPAPWYYFDKTNELIVSTESIIPLSVEVKISNGSLLTTLSVVQGFPVRYRFSNPPCGAACTPAHYTNTLYNAEGLIVSSTDKIAVSIRNVESDQINGGNPSFIKGNSSLSSYGDQGLGVEFRLGYYRSNYSGLNGIGSLAAPLYSVMAISNNTQISLNGNALISLNAGQAYCFQTAIGSLLTSNKSVVVNSGNWGDAPGGCTDGVFTQVLPVANAGYNYIIVRGKGTPGTSTNLPEQSTIIATQNNTTVTVNNYNDTGIFIGTTNYILLNAGDYQTIFHGDAATIYSSSNIIATKPVVVYQGVADNCENDMSMTPPLDGCTGSNRIEIRKFRSYLDTELPYVGNILINDPTAIVYVNGTNIETASGNLRFQIGNTGYYLIRFTNTEVSNQEEIIVNSSSRMSVSIVEKGGGFSMAGFYSSFSDTPEQPIYTSNSSSYCLGSLLTAETGLAPYQWYFNGEIIPGATNQTYIPTAPGNYSVSGTRDCGDTRPSPNYLVNCTQNIPIDAINDDLTPNPINGYQGGIAGNIFSNNGNGQDTFNLLPVIASEMNILLVNNGGLNGVTITDNGIVTIPNATPAGTYILTYSICEKLNPNNCDQATITILVTAPVIDAVNDINNPQINSETGASISLYLNDTLNTLTLVPNEVIFTLDNNGGISGSSINNNGILLIPAGTPIGEYTITYSICEIINPSNCDTAIATIIVKDPCDFDNSPDSCDVIVNNYISVNSDYSNEYLHLEGIERYPDNSIEIFNRWGVIVYKIEGYNNGINAFRGISEGRLTLNLNAKLPEGTYYYFLKYKKSNGTIKEKAGYLYLKF
jgi:gliding motility-associated-like protein